MKSYDAIKKITVTTDGYVGNGYAISVDFETGELGWSTNNLFYQPPKPFKILDKESLLIFKEKIKALNLLDWEKKYYDLTCLDGPMWEIKVNFEGDFEKFSGTAAYPDNWAFLCDLIRNVFQKDFK